MSRIFGRSGQRRTQNTDFLQIVISKVLRDLAFNKNQPLKSDHAYCIDNLKIKIESSESIKMGLIKKISPSDLNQVHLCLRNEFYNMGF
jgi:hypothetical protein